MADYWLTTERLALRRFSPADLDWLIALYGDTEVMRYVGGIRSREQTAEILESRILRYYEEHPGLGMWMTLDRASGVPLGFHLLNHMWGEPHIQVGFLLARSAWGQGIGSEMARALLRYGYTTLALPRIVAVANLANVASHRVLLKVGLQRHGERTFPHPNYAASGPLAWFERDRASWIVEDGHHRGA